MTTTNQVAEVARRLTKAQRACLTRGSDLGGIAVSISSGRALVEHGLAVFTGGRHGTVLDWTPCGLAVRAHLEASDNDR